MTRYIALLVFVSGCTSLMDTYSIAEDTETATGALNDTVTDSDEQSETETATEALNDTVTDSGTAPDTETETEPGPDSETETGPDTSDPFWELTQYACPAELWTCDHKACEMYGACTAGASSPDYCTSFIYCWVERCPPGVEWDGVQHLNCAGGYK